MGCSSQPQLKKLEESLKNLLIKWESPYWSIFFSFIVYGAFSVTYGLDPSTKNYYSYLADAILHGKFYFLETPPSVLDLVYFEGKYFLIYPPMPSFLLIPLVVVFGVDVSDVVFTLVIASVNVGLLAYLLRVSQNKRLFSLSSHHRATLVLFFALGTVHITLAPMGKVWYTGQIVALFFVLLAYIVALRWERWRAFLLFGLALGAATLSRSHLFLVGIWPAVYLLFTHRDKGIKTLMRYSVLGLLPVIV